VSRDVLFMRDMASGRHGFSRRFNAERRADVMI
jgi:hypothetical protein